MNFVRSNGCHQNKVVLDLYDVVQLARKHDLENANFFLKATKDYAARSIPPTGFFYHEGRCGSTLVSNSAVALDPEKTRVYSEPIPPMKALLFCEKTRGYCNFKKAVSLFRDVVYMMGRTSNPLESRLFFKLLPSSVLAMDVVKEAYPEVPWIFIYRDPLHVMVSNLRDPDHGYAPGPYCTEGMKHGEHSEFVREIVARAGRNIGDLTREEYCAANLVSGGNQLYYGDYSFHKLLTLLPIVYRRQVSQRPAWSMPLFRGLEAWF